MPMENKQWMWAQCVISHILGSWTQMPTHELISSAPCTMTERNVQSRMSACVCARKDPQTLTKIKHTNKQIVKIGWDHIITCSSLVEMPSHFDDMVGGGGTSVLIYSDPRCFCAPCFSCSFHPNLLIWLSWKLTNSTQENFMVFLFEFSDES